MARNVRTAESIEIIKFVKVLILIIIVIMAIYLFTRIFVTKDLFNKADNNSDTKEVEISYDNITLGSLFNRPYDEYYVIVYDTTKSGNDYYEALVANFSEDTNATKIYTADLNNVFNKDFYDENGGNKNSTSIDDLKVGDQTLIRVNNGKITKFLMDRESISKELEVTK